MVAERLYQGDLDLSGRHFPRCQLLNARLADLVSETTFLGNRFKLSTRTSVRWDMDLLAEVPYDETFFDFDPPSLWDDFAAKWRLGSAIDFGDLSAYLLEYHEYSKGKLRLQTLLLTDLPPEILDQIMSLSSVQELRSCSTTCKLLRELALVHVYKDVEYRLDSCDAVDYHLMKSFPDDDMYQDNVSAYVRGIAFSQRDSLLDRMRRVTLRNDILAQTQHLSFSEDWMAEMWHWHERLDCTFHDFVGPLIPPLCAHIRASPLTELTYRTRYLYGSAWKALTLSTSLRNLRLFTTIPMHVETWPLAHSVVNLTLVMLEPNQPDFLWDVIPSCPSALFVQVRGPHSRGTHIPDGVFAGNVAQPLQHIRRMDLRDIVAESLAVLAAALEASGDIPLTHLTVSTAKSHIKRDVALQLVRSLRHAARLQHLRVLGLQYARPDILALLAESAPGLCELVLEHQPSIFRKRRTTNYWPCPSFEYAPFLSGFVHLQHLSLNMGGLDLVYTPQVLPRLEDGYDGAEEEDNRDFDQWYDTYPRTEEDPRSIDFISDNAIWATARLFALYGMALETVSLGDSDIMMSPMAWAVDRDPEGKPILRDEFTAEERSRTRGLGSFSLNTKWVFDERETQRVLGL
ncbi:hypothetical protein BD626DRAFT_494666 [Schizophyllum amplum]|uniref:F-box domain-containing protein n=1 Tax=Schizophyllum amplum TaxID=97359 RepID=A0A550CFH5_9AGAR|nr:hypothetical protein BD626DRAFT_494666 [Auriculariopsis ampla]